MDAATLIVGVPLVARAGELLRRLHGRAETRTSDRPERKVQR